MICVGRTAHSVPLRIFPFCYCLLMRAADLAGDPKNSTAGWLKLAAWSLDATGLWFLNGDDAAAPLRLGDNARFTADEDKDVTLWRVCRGALFPVAIAIELRLTSRTLRISSLIERRRHTSLSFMLRSVIH